MTTQLLPIFRTNRNHRYDIVLDGVTTIIEFHFNARADRWSIHLFDIEDTPIRHGIRLAEGFDLMRRIVLATKPPGELRIVDPTGNDTEPDGLTLGVETQLRYLEEADL